MSDTVGMGVFKSIFTAICLVFALSSCAVLEKLRPESSVDRGVRSPSQDIRFSAYHNIRPTRKSGGGIYEVRFQSPKTIKEVGFEFVNYQVKIYHVELILSNGKTHAVRGFRPQLLNQNQRHLTLRNLPRSGKINGVRFRAEGFQHNNVLFTASLFSPEGFSPKEQGRPIALRTRTKSNSGALGTNLNLPRCLPHNPELSGLLFDIESLKGLNRAEQNYFCGTFIPRFKNFINKNEHVASFLRTGENLEKPLVTVGQNFKYSSHENLIVFPLSLDTAQFAQLSQQIKKYGQAKQSSPRRGLSQENENSRYGLDQGYDEFMQENSQRRSLADVENDEQWGFEQSESPKEDCLKGMMDLGVLENKAQSQCRDVRGFEQGHLGCMNFLIDKYILVHNTHHYCLEARGKLGPYQACMAKLLDLELNHYDSNLFCQRTPARYMKEQLECLELLVESGQSRYKSTQTCQRFTGREERINSCLRTHADSLSKDKLFIRCASR